MLVLNVCSTHCHVYTLTVSLTLLHCVAAAAAANKAEGGAAGLAAAPVPPPRPLQNPVLKECAKPLQMPSYGKSRSHLPLKELKECEGFKGSRASQQEAGVLAAQIKMNEVTGFVGVDFKQTGVLTLPPRIGEGPSMRNASGHSAGKIMFVRKIMFIHV